MNLSDVIKKVWDNGACELFRMLDQCCDIDELSRFLIAAADREGYTLELQKKPEGKAVAQPETMGESSYSRIESRDPMAYRLRRDPGTKELLLQGCFAWSQGSEGGTDWRDLPTVES